MSSTKQKEKEEPKVRQGKPCDEKSLAEYNKAWEDMNDCFERLDKPKKKRK